MNKTGSGGLTKWKWSRDRWTRTPSNWAPQDVQPIASQNTPRHSRKAGRRQQTRAYNEMSPSCAWRRRLFRLPFPHSCQLELKCARREFQLTNFARLQILHYKFSVQNTVLDRVLEILMQPDREFRQRCVRLGAMFVTASTEKRVCVFVTSTLDPVQQKMLSVVLCFNEERTTTILDNLNLKRG